MERVTAAFGGLWGEEFEPAGQQSAGDSSGNPTALGVPCTYLSLVGAPTRPAA